MSVVKIVEIKSALKDLFERENHVSGNPRNLSANMTQDVQSVMKVQPELFSIQASQLPAVCIWTESKDVTPKTIAKTQLAAKRESLLELKIAGVIYNPNMINFDEDPADEDCEKLMENIEEILRSSPQLKDIVTDDLGVLWQMPTRVQYQNFSLSEEVHYRVGIMSLEVSVFH